MNQKWMKSSFIYLLIMVAIIAIIFTVFQPSLGNRDVDISTVVNWAKSGQLNSIEVDGHKLTVTKKNDTQVYQSRKEEGVSVFEILDNAGVSPLEGGFTVKVKESSKLGNIFSIFINFLPLIFFGAVLLFLLRQAQGSNSQALSFGRSKARMFIGNKPSITFNDVAGIDEAKLELQEVVEFLKFPEKFSALGARIPKGVLLVGSPGTGKTLLSRAVAGEAAVPFFSISGSEFVEMFVGVGASRVRDLFDQAKRNAPCIVFIDEIDAVGRHRGAGLGGGHDEREQTLNQILVEMDGFDVNTNVIILAATNRPDILDPALLRPGRFDRRVVLDIPDINGRKAILEVHAKGKPLEKNVDLETLAKQTPGFTGADLANLVNEAAILAARADKKATGNTELEEAIDRVVAGPERKSRLISPKEKEITAYHEAGHALTANMLPDADPVHKISIVARGAMGGYTRLLPTEDRHLYSRSHFKAMLATALGGRVAEDLVFSEITTGASNDLEHATRLARKMITEYGMSDSLGPRTFGRKEELVFLGKEIMEQRDYSEKVAEDIDLELQHFIEEADATARNILTTHRQKLNNIAKRLITSETIEGKELKALFSGSPLPTETKRVPSNKRQKSAAQSEPKQAPTKDGKSYRPPKPKLDKPGSEIV
ncbi:MAG: ATP-dependent zinc metalloprotease FtsH [Dehalococcoidia bacterium]